MGEDTTEGFNTFLISLLGPAPAEAVLMVMLLLLLLLPLLSTPPLAGLVVVASPDTPAVDPVTADVVCTRVFACVCVCVCVSSSWSTSPDTGLSSDAAEADRLTPARTTPPSPARGAASPVEAAAFTPTAVVVPIPPGDEPGRESEAPVLIPPPCTKPPLAAIPPAAAVPRPGVETDV